MRIFTETPRLLLREILPADVDSLFELDNDPEVHRYLGNKPIQTKEQAAEMIAFIRQQYVDNGIGRWAVIDKQTNNFLGWAGLKLITEQTNNHINYLDVGYRLIKKYWGLGIATEAARASLAYAFNELQATAVYAITDSNNAASHHVLLKIGLNFVETFVYHGFTHNWYEINR
ncbi:GNAT family N-acetyltransferase [Niastella koreensis]|uniref:GCN5-related N-acetyltransferase n=2 Tax=Niastella koreensis TaxID=354356 RepID=G8TMZ8_NIAKG|nr:GNAT family N-acetyltransferase [Niastella koreensis]AEV96660.1 GCN5-related N-acetyltransferase [Niastella koreensis GR20-10]OQP54166.1 GNAT family N-acetyltransferase [Niastella koreensis]